MPRSLRPALTSILEEWQVPTGDPRGAIDAIVARLGADYVYALEFRSGRRDPVLAFLQDERRGHCELFASATALLLRARGVPTRIVSGYRVVERSPLADYAIVRDRDAHAWVEAWVEGEGWVTVDSTPAGPLASPTETPPAAAVWDLLQTGWARADDWIAERSGLELTLLLAALLIVFVVVRWLRERGADARKVRGGFPAPLPAFRVLERALAGRQLTRGASEPVEAYAARVEAARELDRSISSDIARTLRAYAAHRYGGVGAEADVARDLERVARRLRTA